MNERCQGTGCQTRRETMRGKVAVSLFGTALLAAVLWPIGENWQEAPQDGFPLSYYPMFTKRRPEVVKLTHLLGCDAQGRQFLIPYTYAGTGGLNQVRRQITKTVRQGKADRLCRRVAGKLERRNEARFQSVAAVHVVTARYRLDAFFRGNRLPESMTIEATRKIKRDPT